MANLKRVPGRAWLAIVCGIGAVAWLAWNVPHVGNTFQHGRGSESVVSAAELGDVRGLQKLLAAGADPESRKGQWSALTRAVLFGQDETVAALLASGAGVNAHNPRIGNIVNLKTRRAYQKDVAEFSRFARLRSPAELWTITRAHAIAWPATPTRVRRGSTIRRQKQVTRNIVERISI